MSLMLSKYLQGMTFASARTPSSRMESAVAMLAGTLRVGRVHTPSMLAARLLQSFGWPRVPYREWHALMQAHHSTSTSASLCAPLPILSNASSFIDGGHVTTDAGGKFPPPTQTPHFPSSRGVARCRRWEYHPICTQRARGQLIENPIVLSHSYAKEFLNQVSGAP